MSDLTPSAYPDALAYLDTWSCALVGRSAVGMTGYAPLSYQTIDAWSRLTGMAPEPHEVDALLLLDAIRLHPTPSQSEPNA